MTDSLSGSPLVHLRPADGARAVVALQGAHVTSWVPAGDEERLFLSARSAFAPGAAIRGGVPVIFPQFAAFGPLPKHGFARTSRWALVAAGDDAATLRLEDDAATRALWPHAFAAEVTVRVRGRSLSIALAVKNPGAEPLAFTAALHTYLRVDDVERVEVRGLEGTRYREGASGGVERVQGDAALRIAGEVDRIHFDARRPVEVRDGARETRVEARAFPDVVVWNPGAELAARLADLEPGGWRRMLCVEAAVVGEPVRLAPGAWWEGSQTLVAVG